MKLLHGLIGALVACATVSVSAEPSTISMKATDKVVVVGGGPAGVHYASLLAKKGINNIVLIEAADKVGGKSKTEWDDHGRPQEMGTVFALDSYTPVFDLINQYDPANYKFPFAFERPNYLATMGESAGARDSDATTSIDFPEYLLRSIEIHTQADRAADANVTATELNRIFLAQAMRYINLHREIFGLYPYGMPPQPKDWSLIDMTAMEFLKKNNLTALIGMLRFSQQQQGYGVLETIPAFYFLWWSHPNAMSKILSAQVSKSPCAYELAKGFQSIWLNILAAHKRSITPILGARVVRVNRGNGLDIKPSVVYRNKTGDNVTISCDHVVMAVDLSLYADLIDDLAPVERELFVGTYTASTYISTLYESYPSPVETASQIWLDRMNEGGRVSSIRNTKLTLSERNATDWGDLVVGRQVRVAYQFYDKPLKEVNLNEATSLLRSDLKLAGMKEAAVWGQFYFNYFPRFTSEGLRRGLPWKILEIQGQRSTTWVGSSVCFESALDVVTYNNNLIKSVQVVA